MPIAFRAATTNALTVANTSLSVNKPTGVVDGDVLIVGLSLRGSSGAITAPSNWTLVANTANGVDTFHNRVATYVKVASGEGASWSWTFSSTTGAIAAVAYSGGNTTTPQDVAGAGQQSAVQSTSIVAPTLTTVTANTMLVCVFGSASTQVMTPPAGMTERADVNSGKGLSIAELAVASIGATSTQTATVVTTDWNNGHSIVLRQAAVFTPRKPFTRPQAVNRATSF